MLSSACASHIVLPTHGFLLFSLTAPLPIQGRPAPPPQLRSHASRQRPWATGRLARGATAKAGT
eukprot:365842-Chlamydomonas_euryale.AAC.9